MDNDETDIGRVKAERLVEACRQRGLEAVLHWDRSPWCAQVFLTDDHDEYAPALFLFVEDEESYKIHSTSDVPNGWRWHGQITVDREQEWQDELYDVNIQIIERTWLGDTERDVANKVAIFTSMIDVSAVPA